MTNEQRAKVLTTEALHEALKMTNSEEIKQVILNELATRQEVYRNEKYYARYVCDDATTYGRRNGATSYYRNTNVPIGSIIIGGTYGRII